MKISNFKIYVLFANGDVDKCLFDGKVQGKSNRKSDKFYNFFYDSDREKINIFFKSVSENGHHIAGPFILKDDGNSVFLVGGFFDNRIIVFIFEKDSNHVASIYDELLRIINDQTNVLRDTIKELEYSKSDNPDRTNYDEITVLNNELINTKRLLAKQKSQLEESLEREKIINKQLKEEITKRKRLEKMREDVERIIRHDLRSPLNPIVSFSSMLLKGIDVSDYEKKEIYGYIHENAIRMNEMISNSLDLYKMEEGTYQMNYENVNLIDVIEKVIKDTISISMRKSIKVDFKVTDCDMVITGERIHLISLFSNLIRNAVEASPENSEVTIDAKSNDEKVLIIIENTGDIPLEIRDTFFERYSTSGKKTGTGLGTYSANMIAKAHNGHINFKTGEGETVLYVELPRKIFD